MVGRAPEGQEPEVTLEIVPGEPQPKPVAVGGGDEGGEPGEEQVLPGEPAQPRSEGGDVE